LLQAIQAIVGPELDEPTDWGSAFVAFPSRTRWSVPSKGWHIDANYRSPLFPARGVKTLALLAKVEPRGGGTLVLSGSHRLVHGWFERHTPPLTARSAELRQLLRAIPYIDSLLSPGDAEERIARFMQRSECADGVPLQVSELTGNAGDVFLTHPLLMHTAAPNNRDEPRLMVSGGVTTNMWGWGD
jgi:ectoine hydroxylase-related dioxygenase (phytanoyl-CoA dioxygenase family)